MSCDGSQTHSDEGSTLPAQLTRLVQLEMEGTWRRDPAFFKRFFPVNAKTKYDCLNLMRTLYNYREKRWKGIQRKIKSVASLTTSFVILLNKILDVDDLNKSRKFFKTNSLKVNSSRQTVTSPSIFLAGSGSEFMNTGVDVPHAQYAQGIAPFEVRLQSSNKFQGRGRLAGYAREIFYNQENRRFIFGVILTQHTLSVCMFDYSGAICSDPLDYHANPQQFCALILGLASKDAIRIGFDMTMYREGRSSKIRTTQSDGARRTRQKMKLPGHGTVYTIVSKIHSFVTFVRGGTRCWLAYEDGTKEEFVVKDRWTVPEKLAGQESEASLLSHARSKGVVRGIPQVHHCEDIYIRKGKDMDTIMHNRKLRGPNDYEIERVHNRTVLTPYGKNIDEFSTREEFLLAYYDAFIAHRNLYEKAGILHRDVSVRNILIRSDGEEGDRGILIDLDSAIRIDNKSPYSTKKKIGTWPYKSRNVLQGGQHTYIDDLESFFYVLCFIVVGYAGPSTLVIPRPRVLSGWEGPFPYGMKHGIIVDDFDLPVSEWFGAPFQNLCVKMHSFFMELNWKELEAEDAGHSPPKRIPSVDYEEFDTYIRQAIVELRDTSPLPHPLDVGTDIPGELPLQKTVRRRIPVQRPRRTTAQYR